MANSIPVPPNLAFPDTVGPFRYFCQRVLPAVYGDELSYYELLCKVVDYLNKTLENVNDINGNVQELDAYVKQLKNYVDDYFTNLDVQTAINNKLDDMAKSGELQKIVNVKLIGKKFLMYGDSTAALGPKRFSKYFEQYSGCEVVNRAVSGTTITPSSLTINDNSLYWLVNIATSKDFEGYDGVFLCYGTNEWQMGYMPFAYNGTMVTSSTRSTQSSLFHCINRIQTLNKTIQIYVIIPAYGHRDFNGLINVNHRGFRLEDYGTAMKDVCKLFNIPVIDLYHEMGITETNYKDWLVDDSGGIFVHYNDSLKDRIGFKLNAEYPYTMSNEGNSSVGVNLIGYGLFPPSSYPTISYAQNVISGNNTQMCKSPAYKIPASSTVNTLVKIPWVPNQKLNIQGWSHSDGMPSLKVKTSNLPASLNPIAVITQNGEFSISTEMLFYQNNDYLIFENESDTDIYLFGLEVYYGDKTTGPKPSQYAFNTPCSLAPYLTNSWKVKKDNPAYLKFYGNEVVLGGVIESVASSAVIGSLPRGVYTQEDIVFTASLTSGGTVKPVFIKLEDQTGVTEKRKSLTVIDGDGANMMIAPGNFIAFNTCRYIISSGEIPTNNTAVIY